MRVTLIVEETKEEDGLDNTMSFTREDVVYLEDWEVMFTKWLNATGYTYVSGVKVVCDE